MRNARRPMGRFFCLLKWLAAVVAMAVTMSAQTNGPTMTQVVDTVYRADGTAARGTVLISWPAFTTMDGKAVAAGSISVQLGNGGAFAANLAPNTGAQPAGVYYKVIYQLFSQEPSTEYWAVPSTASTTIGAVRAKLQPQTIAAQILTRDVADTNYVHVAGDQTVDGVKTFVALASASFQGIQYVCQQNGNDIGAKFQKAYNNLPLDGLGDKLGTVSFDGCSGYYSWTTPVTMTGARVKVAGNSNGAKVEMQCNTTNCLTLGIPSSWATSDGSNGSIFEGFEMDGNSNIAGQCGITVSDVYNVKFQDLYFYGFSGAGSAPICVSAVAANSTGAEGVKLISVMFSDNYYGVSFTNVAGTSNASSFGYQSWTGVRWFGGVAGGAAINLNSGIVYHSFFQFDPNTNASNSAIFRARGLQNTGGPGSRFWYNRIEIPGECDGQCSNSYIFDMGEGTSATNWVDYHTSTEGPYFSTGAGTATSLTTGVMDNQTVSYVGHHPMCSGNLEQSQVGGNYQACMLPFDNWGSYVQGFSWNMTYDRNGHQYQCLGDGTANGCSAALANNAGNINFVAIPFNGGTTQNIPANGILNYTLVKMDTAGTHFLDGVTRAEKAKVDSNGNATVQDLTVNGMCVGCGGGSGGDLASPPAIGSVAPNTGTFTTLTASSVNGTLNAAAFPGTDPCAQINNAIAALPSAGVVDASGFTAAQISGGCATTINVAVASATLRFGAGAWKLGGNPGINVSAPKVTIECPKASEGDIYNTVAATLMSSAAHPLIADTVQSIHSTDGLTVRNCYLDGNGVGTIGLFLPYGNSGHLENIYTRNFTSAGQLLLGGQWTMWAASSGGNVGDGLILGFDSGIDGNAQFAGNQGSAIHLVSGGNVLHGVGTYKNRLHGIFVDGRAVGDWAGQTAYVQQSFIRPATGNPGNFVYFTQTVGTTGSARPGFCQVPGCTINDGSVVWINAGTGYGYTPASIFENAWWNFLESANSTSNGYHAPQGFDADDIRVEGTVAHPAFQNAISAAMVRQSEADDSPAHGVHLINTNYATINNVQWLGAGYSNNTDLGGLRFEASKGNAVTNVNCWFSYLNCIQLVAANNSTFTGLNVVNNGLAGTPTAGTYALAIDGASTANTVNDLNVRDDRGPAYSRGVSDAGMQTIVGNYRKSNLAANPDSYGAGYVAEVSTSGNPTYNIGPGQAFTWKSGGIQTGRLDASGNLTVGGELSVKDIPGHEYFVSKFANIQAAIDAAYNNGTVQGGATVIDDRLAPYSGVGFIVKDSVTLKLAATTYTISGTVTYNNGVGNVTAGIISMPGSHIVGVGTSSNHGTIITAGAGLNADLVVSSTIGTGTGANAQWWHWGSIESLNISGTSQASGRCLVVENMGETARVENILARSCYGNNIEIIGSSASQSSIRNITTMRSQTASGIRFTNLSGVGKVDGLSGDCNPTSLVSVQENAAGSLTILGLKAEGEASICTGQVHDPVVLLDGVSGFNDHVRIIGGYAFGTAQGSFAKFVNAGNAILETEGLYITGYTNMLNDTVRGVTVPLSSSTSKQPFYYEPGGTTYANQAFTLTGGTFVQGQPATTPTEIFGLTTGSATLLAAAGNGDNSSILTGGIQISGQNRAQYGTPPEIMARWGYRWLGAGLGYDTTNFDLVPAWNSADTSSRNLGNALSVCKKGSTTVSCRWPNIYALNIDTTSLTLNGSAVTIPVAGATTPNMDGTGAAGSSSNYARADHVHPSDTSRAAANASTTVNGVICALGGSCTPPGSPVAYSGTGSVTMTNSGSTAYSGFPITAISAGAMTADASYMVTVEVAETAPGVGTCAGTANFSMAFKDPDTTTTYAINTVFFPFLSLSNVTSVVGSVAINTAAKGAANTFTSIPRTLRMAAGTAVQFQFLQNAADGASCSMHPTFTWRVAIVGPLPY